MYDFPASPSPGDEYTPPVGGQTYIWSPPKWLVKGIPPAGGGGGVGIDEAPVDGNQYAREDAAWSQVIIPATDWASIPGKPATFPPTVPIPWTDVSGKPATYPPTLPIAQADVTGLVAGQAAQDTAISGKLNTSAYTAADVLAKLITVDGSGSALDADLLDGQNGSWYRDWANLTSKPATFPPSAHNHPQSEVTNLVTDLAAKAPLASPVFTGDPQAPTPATADNDTSIATTAYVKANLASMPPAGATISDTAPSSPFVGQLWFESDSGNTYVWYNDGNTSQWVMVGPGGGVTNAPLDSTHYTRRGDIWQQAREASLTAATYVFSSATTGAGLALGGACVDNSYGPNITKVWVHEQEGDGTGWSTTLNYVKAGWFLIIEDRNYRPNSLILQINGDGVKTGSVYEWTCKWIGGQYNISGGKSITVSAQPGRSAGTAEARNRLVNPAMQISQERGNTGGNTTACFIADQWSVDYVSSVMGVWLQTQYAVTPNGSVNRLNIQVGSGDASIASGDYFTISQKIEGIRVADLKWGTSSAKPVVLRFGFNGPAGTYTAFIQNGAKDKNYLMPFTVTAGQAYTDLTKVFSIPGEQYGTWLKTTGIGMIVGVTLASGSSFQGSDLYWNGGAYVGSYSQTNGLVSSNLFDLFDVGLYADPNNTGVPPPWQMPDEADELIACQRYWKKNPDTRAVFPTASTTIRVIAPIDPPMRATPAVTLLNGTNAIHVWQITNATVNSISTTGCFPAFFDVTLVASAVGVAQQAASLIAGNVAINARM